MHEGNDNSVGRAVLQHAIHRFVKVAEKLNPLLVVAAQAVWPPARDQANDNW